MRFNKNIEIPKYKEFSNVPDTLINKEIPQEIKHAMPSWLYQRLNLEIPENLDVILTNSNKPAPIFLRVNTIKSSISEVLGFLDTLKIPYLIEKKSKVAIKLLEKTNVFNWEIYKNGFVELQDYGSQQIAEFLPITHGNRIIDACAGAGGKSLHIAAIIKNKGKIISLDVSEKKLMELKKRAKRAGIQNIETKLIENIKTIKRLKFQADIVLLDVPCSGLGVLRRNPDAKWKLSNQFIDETIHLQQKILSDYEIMVKPGGYLCYATCSILPSENEHQVKTFLQNFKNYSLVQEKKVVVGTDDSDGFYMALLKKEG